MSDKSPEETPDEKPLDESTLDEPTPEASDEADSAAEPEAQDTGAEAIAESDEDADVEAESDPDEESDDETIARLDEDLPADDTEKAPAPIRRRTAKAPVKKTTATRKRSEAEKEKTEDPYKAKNPAHYARQSAGELKQVTWPTWGQLVTSFFAVLVFVLFIIAFVGVLDAVLGWGLLQILGN